MARRIPLERPGGLFQAGRFAPSLPHFDDNRTCHLRFHGQLGLITLKNEPGKALQHPYASAGCHAQGSQALGTFRVVSQHAKHHARLADVERRQAASSLKT